MITAKNPATGETIKEYPEMDAADVDLKVLKAAMAQKKWEKESFKNRAELLLKASEILLKRKDEFATLMAQEMGKPIAQGRAEIEKCAKTCVYYAENGEAFLKDEIVETEFLKSFAAFRPMGVVLAVMPWNFPFWQVWRFLAPALMAGNGGVLKHASNVPGCALAIEEVVREAGFPDGIFSTLMISSKDVERVIANPNIAAVTLTGSTAAGSAVAATAGQFLKKSVMELGGSDAYIVLKDADLPNAAKACAASRLNNTGQSCVAAKRFIVVEEVFDEFEKLFVAEMESRSFGDPLDEKNALGPLARHDLRDELHEQVLKSIKLGAEAVIGGRKPIDAGAYYPPTVLKNVVKGMPAYDEELFGPVASMIRAKDEADAIRIANDSVYGLGGAVFTQDLERGERIAREEIQSGGCFVNDFLASDPRLPFGGIKQSGYGRELSVFGIREFVNIKTVCVKEVK
ncbi:MAG: NAD-dependent succinate-semialdehyde dehydrogenase [Bacteroidota bacterium]